MKALLRTLLAWFGLSRRRNALGIRQIDRSGAFHGMSAAQLRDIGLWRDDVPSYLRLREPPALDVLFPRSGGTPPGGGSNSRSGPTRPRISVNEDVSAG